MPLEVRVNQSLKLNRTKTWNMKLLSETFKGWVPQHGCTCVVLVCVQTSKQKKIILSQPLCCLHQAKEFWEMGLKEKLELAAKVKLKGNQYFKVPCFWSKLEKHECYLMFLTVNSGILLSQAGRHFQAVNLYQRIISWLEMECGAALEEQKIIRDFLLKSHLNLALCYLRMEELSHVVENCNKVIWKTPMLDLFTSPTVIRPQTALDTC